MEENWWQPNGDVYSVIVDDSNDLVYLGGDFSGVSPYKPYGAIVDTSGVVDLGTDNFNKSVSTMIPDQQGRMVRRRAIHKGWRCNSQWISSFRFCRAFAGVF